MKENETFDGYQTDLKFLSKGNSPTFKSLTCLDETGPTYFQNIK